MFWCGINHDIDEMIKSCARCQAHQVANTKDTLIPHDMPIRAWHTLATDLFHWNGTGYLLIANFYSKFRIIRKLRNISSSTIINHLQGIFDEHAIPERLISDNGRNTALESFWYLVRNTGSITLQAHHGILGRKDSQREQCRQ